MDLAAATEGELTATSRSEHFLPEQDVKIQASVAQEVETRSFSRTIKDRVNALVHMDRDEETVRYACGTAPVWKKLAGFKSTLSFWKQWLFFSTTELCPEMFDDGYKTALTPSVFYQFSSASGLDHERDTGK